jgi:hypothetical protein
MSASLVLRTPTLLQRQATAARKPANTTEKSSPARERCTAASMAKRTAQSERKENHPT